LKEVFQSIFSKSVTSASFNPCSLAESNIFPFSNLDDNNNPKTRIQNLGLEEEKNEEDTVIIKSFIKTFGKKKIKRKSTKTVYFEIPGIPNPSNNCWGSALMQSLSCVCGNVINSITQNIDPYFLKQSSSFLYQFVNITSKVYKKEIINYRSIVSLYYNL
jgi:hypothetical protein